MPKVLVSNSEILVDFTNQQKLNDNIRSKIKILQNSYTIPPINKATKKNVNYNQFSLNLFYLQCTCKEFKEGTKKYNKRDIRRICKHLYYKLITDLDDDIDQLTRLLLDSKFWLNELEVIKVSFIDEVIYCGFSDLEFLINVYRFDGKWKRFRFNSRIKVWKDEKPFVSEELNIVFEKFLYEIRVKQEREQIIHLL